MKKVLVFLILAILLLSMAFVYAEKGGNADNKNNVVSASNLSQAKTNEVKVEKGEKTKIKANDKEAETELAIEEEKENNKTILKAKLSNGRKAEVKIMPDTASARAIERLGQLNFTVQLKEVGEGNETKLTYEAKAEKKYKILGFLKKKAEVRAEIDAETGDVKIKKPWWSFLAREED